MAAHKGPASLRPRCIRSGSSVAAIPVYQSSSSFIFMFLLLLILLSLTSYFTISPLCFLSFTLLSLLFLVLLLFAFLDRPFTSFHLHSLSVSVFPSHISNSPTPTSRFSPPSTSLPLPALWPTELRSRFQKSPAWPTFYGERNEANLLFFNTASLWMSLRSTNASLIQCIGA
jgi:hypothetical protein